MQVVGNDCYSYFKSSTYCFQNVQGIHWMILELSMHDVKHHKHDLITLTYKTQQMIDILLHRQLTK